jgi:FkbM family methyltransferase
MMWHLRPRRRARRDGPTLTAEEAFEIAYGRCPSEAETARLRQPGHFAAATDAGRLRSVITGFDRLKLATPIAVRFTETDIETVDCGDFRLLVDRSDDAVGRALLNGGAYEPHLSRFVRQVVKPGMVAIDIGANIGYYTMLLSRLVGPSGRVLAFEPNSENCRMLLLSRGVNEFENIDLFPFAASTGAGAVCFTAAIGSNGALLPNLPASITDANCVVVPSLSLDSLPIERADFIKLDIEGAEYLALTGAEQLVRGCRPVIATEFSLEMLHRVSGIAGADFLRWLQNLGYRLYLLGRADAPIEAIADPDRYLAGWGDPLRVEDLALIPSELDFDPRS